MGGDGPDTWDALRRFEFGAGLLHVRSDLPVVTDGSLAPRSDPYHGQVLRVPGVRRVRRFELAGAFAASGEPGAAPVSVGEPPEPARFLTLYDLKHPGVLDTPAFRAVDTADAAVVPAEPPDEPPCGLRGGLDGLRLVCLERCRWPRVSIARLFPAGDKLLHLAVQGERAAMERWLDEEAVPTLLPALGAVGVRWFDAGEGRHVVLCELQGPIWPLPPPVAHDLGPAVWSAYRQEYVRNAPGE
ncbi:hypothetical protein [Yinghuangia seranimata]|uniref:hypothetical protein n=1 Tax=Yinghuangia seranimata TaxID=408067 RepID=UPI00248B77A5|nr:hypothetical protein [Yinghuangia seranimata]MDI2125912.1 hypothetical protein [Yinghuangia seranimata]